MDFSKPLSFFKESKALLKNWRQSANLPYGISVRVGRWLVPGNPVAILVNFDGVYPKLDDFYALMWEKFKVDSLHSYGDYGEGCAFAIASAIVIDSLSKFLAKKRPCCRSVQRVDHRHGTALSESQLATDCDRLHNACHKHRKKHLRQRKAPLRLLQRLQRRPDGIRAQYAVETFPGKTAAHNADCFTTVSDITARECEQLLEIKPLVTPNGFELSIVPERQKYTAQRKKARAKLLQVAEALTGKHYDDDTFLYATAGRNEFRNKGLDMFIDATNALRNGHDMNRQTIAFILVPAWENGAREDLKSRLEKARRKALWKTAS